MFNFDMVHITLELEKEIDTWTLKQIYELKVWMSKQVFEFECQIDFDFWMSKIF
jgi:hypothetical protein